MKRNTAGQTDMENEIKSEIEKMYLNQSGSVNAMMEPEFVECSIDEKTLTLEFPVLEWEKNRVGYMHGGMIAAAFDIVTGLLARFLAGQSFAPTIQLETVFIRPIPLGDVFVVRVKTNLAGRKLTHIYGEGYIKSTNKLAATVTSSYYNEDTASHEIAEKS
ncbi:MAG: PaaI family thioesterase [Eubacteriales bacterium]|nr:PaaI family thioesterase [Eubacteriales bacterium]